MLVIIVVYNTAQNRSSSILAKKFLNFNKLFFNIDLIVLKGLGMVLYLIMFRPIIYD